MTLFPHLPDNTENKSQNKSEDTYPSRVHTGSQKCPAALSNPSSSHADTMATMLATNKPRIPDMSALVESIEHLSKDGSRLIKSYKNPEHFTNDNFETSMTKESCSVPTCYNSFPRLSPKQYLSLCPSPTQSYNGASLTLSKGVELPVPLDLSNLLQTKAHDSARFKWALDRKSRNTIQWCSMFQLSHLHNECDSSNSSQKTS